MSKNSYKSSLNNAKIARIAEVAEVNKEEYLYFDSEVYANLPKCLMGFFQFPSPRQNDMFLNALLTVLGLIVFNVTGVYDQKRTNAILYSINCGPAASGKGVQNLLFSFLDIVHEFLLEKVGKKLKLDKIACPGNSSAAAIMNFLVENDLAFINETEIDVIITALNQDWGDYTTILRQNYQGERITVNRIESGYRMVKNPRLALSFAGTKDQVIKLFKNTDNGLFTRFMIYMFDEAPSFRSVKPDNSKKDQEANVVDCTLNILPLLDDIWKQDINFNLSDSQWEKHHQAYDKLIKGNFLKYGSTATSTITRMGLMHYRICLILSVFRNAENGTLASEIVCSDQDFDISGKLMNVYYTNLKHTLEIIPHEAAKIKNNGAWELFQLLPEGIFSTGVAKQIAQEKEICSPRSVDKYIQLLVKEKQIFTGKGYGNYIKPASKDK